MFSHCGYPFIRSFMKWRVPRIHCGTGVSKRSPIPSVIDVIQFSNEVDDLEMRFAKGCWTWLVSNVCCHISIRARHRKVNRNDTMQMTRSGGVQRRLPIQPRFVRSQRTKYSSSLKSFDYLLGHSLLFCLCCVCFRHNGIVGIWEDRQADSL